jgi:hypothetical protein
LATNLAASLHLQTNGETAALLRPLLDDLLQSESMAGMGGRPATPSVLFSPSNWIPNGRKSGGKT